MLTFIEVFAGCGGLSTGLIAAGLQPLLLVDNDKNCVATLERNHEKNIVQQADVKTLDLSKYKCHLLAGGVPCQSFSQSGKRKGLEDPRGSLFNDFARLIKECNPNVFIVENVHGLLTINKGDTFKQIIKMLNVGNAYKIKHQMFNCIEYDVPQKRKRILIVGVKTHLPEYMFPIPSSRRVLLRDVLTDCPPSEGVKYSDAKRRIMELIPQGGCWVDLPDDIKTQYMGNSLNSGGGKRGIARRLAMDEACLTLTTSPYQKQTERCHPLETRPLTVREYARIQTFPDSYEFAGSITSQYKQIGNAVPCKFAEHVGKSLLTHFELCQGL